MDTFTFFSRLQHHFLQFVPQAVTTAYFLARPPLWVKRSCTCAATCRSGSKKGNRIAAPTATGLPCVLNQDAVRRRPPRVVGPAARDERARVDHCGTDCIRWSGWWYHYVHPSIVDRRLFGYTARQRGSCLQSFGTVREMKDEKTTAEGFASKEERVESEALTVSASRSRVTNTAMVMRGALSSSTPQHLLEEGMVELFYRKPQWVIASVALSTLLLFLGPFQGFLFGRLIDSRATALC